MQLSDWLGSSVAPAWMDMDPRQDPALYFAVVAIVLLVLFAPLAVLLLRMYGRIVPREAHSEPPPPPMLLMLPYATSEAQTTYPSAPAMIHAQPPAPAHAQLPPWYVHRARTMESAAPVFPPPPPLSSLQIIFDEPSRPEVGAALAPAAHPPRPSHPPHEAALPPQPPARVLPNLDFDMKPTTMLDRPLPPVSDTRPDLSDLAFDPTVAAMPDQIPPSRAPLPCRVLPPASHPPSRRPTIRPVAPSAPRTPPPPRPPSLWGRADGVLAPSPSSYRGGTADFALALGHAADPNETAKLTPVTPPTAPTLPRTTRISGR